MSVRWRAAVSSVAGRRLTLGPDSRDSLLTRRMFSGFRSVCTSFSRCRTGVSKAARRGTEGGLTLHTLQQAPGKVLDMPFWEGLEAVQLEKVEHAHAIQLGDETWVVAEVKVLGEVDAFAAVSLVVFSGTH